MPVHGFLYTDETVFDVKPGAEYRVFAMSIWETALTVLICDETGKPNWLPIGLFELTEQALPTNWEFALLDAQAASGGEASNRTVALWGYREMIRNHRHHDELIEREPRALEIFFEEQARRSGEPEQR